MSCEYCENSEYLTTCIVDRDFEDGSWIRAWVARDFFTKPVLRVDCDIVRGGYRSGSAPITYCPMCGEMLGSRDDD